METKFSQVQLWRIDTADGTPAGTSIFPERSVESKWMLPTYQVDVTFTKEAVIGTGAFHDPPEGLRRPKA